MLITVTILISTTVIQRFAEMHTIHIQGHLTVTADTGITATILIVIILIAHLPGPQCGIHGDFL